MFRQWRPQQTTKAPLYLAFFPKAKAKEAQKDSANRPQKVWQKVHPRPAWGTEVTRDGQKKTICLKCQQKTCPNPSTCSEPSVACISPTLSSGAAIIVPEPNLFTKASEASWSYSCDSKVSFDRVQILTPDFSGRRPPTPPQPPPSPLPTSPLPTSPPLFLVFLPSSLPPSSLFASSTPSCRRSLACG